MEIKSLSIGRLTTKNNVFVAPLAGFSDYAFRQVEYELGAGLCFTEMVSAKGLIYNSENTKALLYTGDEYIKAVQLFGSEPEVMAEASARPELEKFDIIDINMGCPVPKVFNNGEGSALMRDPVLVEKLVKACARSGKVVSVKMRLGISEDKFLAKDVAFAAQDGGASFLTIHGRYREGYYSARVDYEKIAEVVSAVKIPVIANGGIFDKSDAETCFKETGAAGIMLARGALSRPWLVSEILSVPVKDKKSVIKRHIDLLLKRYDDKYAAISMRKQMAYYLSGLKDAKKYKIRAFDATTTRELKAIVNELEL